MITLADVKAALERVCQSIYLSPCTVSATFSQLTGNTIYLKLDNLQRTGAFKERGALNKLLTLTEVERSRGVIAASAGNHAQGLAYHAGRHGTVRDHERHSLHTRSGSGHRQSNQQNGPPATSLILRWPELSLRGASVNAQCSSGVPPNSLMSLTPAAVSA